MMIMAVFGPTSRHCGPPWRAVVGSEEIPFGRFQGATFDAEIGSTASGCVFQCPFFWSPTIVLQCATGIHVVEATKDI